MTEENEVEQSEKVILSGDNTWKEYSKEVGSTEENQVTEKTDFHDPVSSQQASWGDEIFILKEKLARLQADYDNFKKRTEREREDMIFFINSKTFSQILPRLDDLERIVLNTPEDLKSNTLFAWVEAMYKAMTRDIEGLGVKVFVSKGQKVNPEKHNVMTQVPWEEGTIIDEFEKWYTLWERVLRHAKVVVWSGNQ